MIVIELTLTMVFKISTYNFNKKTGQIEKR